MNDQDERAAMAAGVADSAAVASDEKKVASDPNAEKPRSHTEGLEPPADPRAMAPGLAEMCAGFAFLERLPATVITNWYSGGDAHFTPDGHELIVDNLAKFSLRFADAPPEALYLHARGLGVMEPGIAWLDLDLPTRRAYTVFHMLAPKLHEMAAAEFEKTAAPAEGLPRPVDKPGGMGETIFCKGEPKYQKLVHDPEDFVPPAEADTFATVGAVVHEPDPAPPVCQAPAPVESADGKQEARSGKAATGKAKNKKKTAPEAPLKGEKKKPD